MFFFISAGGFIIALSQDASEMGKCKIHVDTNIAFLEMLEHFKDFKPNKLSKGSEPLESYEMLVFLQIFTDLIVPLLVLLPTTNTLAFFGDNTKAG